MVSLPVLAIAVLAVAYLVNWYRNLSANIAAAKQSGFHYIVVPVYTFNRFWLITHRLWLRAFAYLPASWGTDEWVPFLSPESAWTGKYDPFERYGDVFLVVSPGRITVNVADAEAHAQITSRRSDFPKPLEFYRSLDLYGKNVVTTEGSIWRHHRKITSPPFSEKNNHLVWVESLHQAKSMLTHWLGPNGDRIGSFNDIAEASMTLSLHIISRAGFGQRLTWKHEEVDQKIPEGHSMTFKDALAELLEQILQVILFPKWWLANSPFKANKRAWAAFTNWSDYMNELYQVRKEEVRSGESSREGLDIMGALVRGAGITSESLNASGAEKGGQLLTDDEIMGNLFVILLAGHETTANTIHFSIVFLAMHWSSQNNLHKDLDDIFGDRDASQWDYDTDVPKLFGGMAGAIMNEELRLIPPANSIPKSTPPKSPQPLTLHGQRYVVPADTRMNLNAVATGRNPKYWPTLCGPNPTKAEIREDLETFKPERWLLDAAKLPQYRPAPTHTKGYDAAGLGDHQDKEKEDVGGPQGGDTSASLFKPIRGAYIPFSEGYRACLGRRFAQVEVLAVIAQLFKSHSIELAVDEWATDEEMARMSEAEKRVVWEKARSRVQELFRTGMHTIITLQMRDGKVPLRWVKKGEERFRFD